MIRKRKRRIKKSIKNFLAGILVVIGGAVFLVYGFLMAVLQTAERLN